MARGGWLTGPGLVDHRLGLDFYPHCGSDAHLRHRAGRAGVTTLSAGPANFGVCDVGDVNARGHHVLDRRTGLLQCTTARGALGVALLRGARLQCTQSSDDGLVGDTLTWRIRRSVQSLVVGLLFADER